MNLIEILDTKVPVEWKVNGHQHLGAFSLDHRKYVIQLDEYDTDNDLTLVDFGFTTDGMINAVNFNKNASSILGAVLNGALPKLRDLNPDVILVSVQKDSGMVESRKNVYSALIRWAGKQLVGYHFIPEWIENTIGFYKLISKNKLSDDEMKKFTTVVKSK